MEAAERRARLETLFNRHAAAVRAYALRRIDRASAEDVVMEVFVIACRRLDELPDDSLPWLLACARRVLANQRRAGRRADALIVQMADAGRGHVESSPAVADGALGLALAELRDPDREILLLSAWEGLEPAQIARVLGCSRAAAAVRLHRARKRLAVVLGRSQREPDLDQARGVMP